MEQRAAEDTDFRTNVSLPFFLNLAGMAATAPIALVAWPVRALGAFLAGFGVGEGLQGQKVSLKPDTFGETTPLTGSDRAWHLVGSTSGVVLSVAGEVQIARSGVPQLVKSPFKGKGGAGTAPAAAGPVAVATEKNPLDLTLGEILEGFDPESMIHLTPEEAAVFAAPRGVDVGSAWARLGDVAHLTLHQYRIAVAGPASSAFFPNARTIVVAPPGADFKAMPPMELRGYPEYQNTIATIPAATVQGPAGPTMAYDPYADLSGVPAYQKPPP